MIGYLYLIMSIASGVHNFFYGSDPIWMLGFLILSKLTFMEDKLKESNCGCPISK